MDILDWIQDWFKDNCDGHWEHGEVIQITTLDNPGWEVEIDKFTAAGDAGKLKFLLGLFKEMIDKIEA